MDSSENITFLSGTDILHGTIDWNEQRDPPTILYIHGSRPGHRGYGDYLTKPLAQAGYSCLRFDLSGHGESNGALDANVQKFTKDAKCALSYMDKTKSLTVIGVSMGGHIAVELLDEANIQNLILFCPALYSDSAYHAPYHERAQSLLRDLDDAPILHKLDGYTGSLLHIIGEQDDIIPLAVTELFKAHTLQAKKRDFVSLVDAPHGLTNWLKDNPLGQEKIVNLISEFLESNNPLKETLNNHVLELLQGNDRK